MKVINLSNISLTDAQSEVLSLGLSFSLASKFDSFLAVKDLQLFARKLLFKKFFHYETLHTHFPTFEEREAIRILESLADEEQEQKGEFPKILIPRSKNFPALSLNANIDLFLKMVTREFQSIPMGIGQDNCSIKQRKAIKELSAMSNILIKPASKGGNVVIWPVQMYEKEAMRQLKTVTCYKKLTFNPMSKFRDELQKFLYGGIDKGIITPKQMKYLLLDDPKTPTLYMLPKVHKDTNNPPG